MWLFCRNSEMAGTPIGAAFQCFMAWKVRQGLFPSGYFSQSTTVRPEVSKGQAGHVEPARWFISASMREAYPVLRHSKDQHERGVFRSTLFFQACQHRGTFELPQRVPPY